MQIEVFSDVVCPWCYIGKRRLEEALSAFDHADQVSVTYRSFQLDPTSPDDLRAEPGADAGAEVRSILAQAREMNDRVLGHRRHRRPRLPAADAHPANTFRAHRLLHFAATKGLGNELTERLMRATSPRASGSATATSCCALAVEVGLDAGESAAVLDSDAFDAEVRADIALARAFGATGVPFFVFDRKYAVSGAQETALFTEVLDKAWADAQPLTVVGGAGVVCEDDSCAVPER